MRPSIVAQYKNAILTYAGIYFISAEHAIFVVEILVSRRTRDFSVAFARVTMVYTCRLIGNVVQNAS